MTIEECYRQAGGDYNEISERIGNTARIQKYLQKFSVDESYQQLLAALAQENWKDAFLCVHNLKGMCATLSLNNAAHAAGVLCEALRHGQPQEISPLFARSSTQFISRR